MQFMRILFFCCGYMCGPLFDVSLNQVVLSMPPCFLLGCYDTCPVELVGFTLFTSVLIEALLHSAALLVLGALLGVE